MFGAKKATEQLVSEFLEKVQQRQQKVSSNLSALRAKSEALTKEIADRTAACVEAEIQENEAQADRIRKSIRELNLELSEVQASIRAYESQAAGRADYSKDLLEIQKASVREVKENREKGESLRQQQVEIDRQIKALELRKKELANEERHLIDAGPARSVEKIMRYILPESRELPQLFDKNLFLHHWTNGDDTAHLFAEPDTRSLRAASGDIQQSPPKPKIHTALLQGVDKRADFERWKANHPNVTIVEMGSLDSSHGALEIKYTKE